MGAASPHHSLSFFPFFFTISQGNQVKKESNIIYIPKLKRKGPKVNVIIGAGLFIYPISVHAKQMNDFSEQTEKGW